MAIKTMTAVPRVGVMLVGWGGNNGTTVTAACIANREDIVWRTKEGIQRPNYYGSITQASTVELGTTDEDEPIYVPMRDMLPMVDPNEIVYDGWDISSKNLGQAMEDARVLDYDLQRQIRSKMDVSVKGLLLHVLPTYLLLCTCK